MASNTADAQMNFRINSGLKAEGDVVFAELGLSPSQAIRAFYEFVAQRRNRPSEVAIILTGSDAAEEGSQKQRLCERIKSCERGTLLVPDFYKAHGIDPAKTMSTSKDYKTLLEEARLDAYLEKGLL